MTRSRASAKKAGTTFERLIANYLAQHLDDRIDRRVKTGAADKGDIAGVRIHDQKLVIECKDTARISLSTWATEAALEAANDGAIAGIIAHKRHGVSDPGKQWVTMTLADLVTVIQGVRP
jgi:hypothetical protein